MTEKKVAANARNRNLAPGPTTVENHARIRATLLRHGFCAQAEEMVRKSLPPTTVRGSCGECRIPEARRVTNLLLKLKRYERKTGTELGRKRR
jgi:hypothetical protein